MSRDSIILAGLAGLAGAVILTALMLLIMLREWIPVLLTGPTVTWGLFFFLLFFSLVEIPVMIFSIRRIAAGSNPKARYVALLATAGYSFFGAVYAAPFILLTGRLVPGAAMAGLSLIRFISAVMLLPKSEK